jgi:hypothetical protein
LNHADLRIALPDEIIIASTGRNMCVFAAAAPLAGSRAVNHRTDLPATDAMVRPPRHADADIRNDAEVTERDCAVKRRDCTGLVPVQGRPD